MSYRVREASNYWNRLSPWCIVQLLPQMQRSVVARFRKRNYAEAHLRALQRLNPSLHYEIVFAPLDPPTEAAIEAPFHMPSIHPPIHPSTHPLLHSTPQNLRHFIGFR